MHSRSTTMLPAIVALFMLAAPAWAHRCWIGEHEARWVTSNDEYYRAIADGLTPTTIEGPENKHLCVARPRPCGSNPDYMCIGGKPPPPPQPPPPEPPPPQPPRPQPQPEPKSAPHERKVCKRLPHLLSGDLIFMVNPDPHMPIECTATVYTEPSNRTVFTGTLDARQIIIRLWEHDSPGWAEVRCGERFALSVRTATGGMNSEACHE